MCCEAEPLRARSGQTKEGRQGKLASSYEEPIES